MIDNEKDIGVYIDHNLSFDRQISAICNKANYMFAVLRRSFQYLDKETFIPLHNTLVQTHLDYAISVYYPFKNKAHRTTGGDSNEGGETNPWDERKVIQWRIAWTQVTNPIYRRIREDVIEAFKIIN